MVYALIVLSIICSDLFTKKLISDKLYIEEKKEIIKNKVYLWHKKNKGFSYNKLEDKPFCVKAISGSVCVFSLFALKSVIFEKRIDFSKLSFCLCFAGAVSNFIDRLKNGSVTDFIYVKFKNAPIFNLADVFIVFGFVSFVLSYFINSLKTK